MPEADLDSATESEIESREAVGLTAVDISPGVSGDSAADPSGWMAEPGTAVVRSSCETGLVAALRALRPFDGVIEDAALMRRRTTAQIRTCTINVQVLFRREVEEESD